MFNKSKFTEYVKQLDTKIYDTLPRALERNDKYSKHYQLQTDRFLRRFDADTSNPRQSLNEMCDFIYKNRLLSNFFEDGSETLISAHYQNLLIGSANFLEPFLIWNTFNENSYLQLQEIQKKPYLVSNLLKHITR